MRGRAVLRVSLLVPVALAAMGTACLRGQPKAVVPLQQTAAEQYAYAIQYQQNKQIELITEDKDYRAAVDVVMQVYQKVIDYFPDDREFTPLAKLDIVTLRCGFEQNSRLDLEGRQLERRMRRALDELGQLSSDYPENDYVQAMSLYLRAMCYKALGQYSEMQPLFRAIMDDYSSNGNQYIRQIAQRAAILYDETYVQE